MTQNPHQHPLVYLKGIKQRHIKSLLNFIYSGETEVAQDDLAGFMEAAAELKIKGLENMNPTSQRDNYDNTFDTKSPDNIQEEMFIKKEVASINDHEYISKEESSMETFDQTGTGLLYFPETYTRKFTCEKCNYKTNVSGHLKRHKLMKHDGVKYPCNHCAQQFSTKDNLKRHQSTQHERIIHQ